jgi:hypothetical protein
VAAGAIELLKGNVPVLSWAVLYLLAIVPVAVSRGSPTRSGLQEAPTGVEPVYWVLQTRLADTGNTHG